jgi:hypothetical protein
MPTPEINVRLTADGVQDVINAFRRVQQEARATKDDVSILGQAMDQMGELIPVISIGLAVQKLVDLGKGALDSAVSIGKLAEKTGASVGTLSVLAMASHDVGVSQDEMGSALTRLARNMEQASQGSTKSQQAFKSLGVSLADIKSKNPADLFVEIAQKLQEMPDGATKAAASMQLFGRSGANLIPVLNEIGENGGFEAAKQKAQDLGLYLSDDFVAQAKAGEEALKNMADITQGFAMQFMSGFVPQAAGAVEDLNKTISEGGAGAFKNLGDIAGNALRGILNLFLVLIQTVGVLEASIVDGVGGAFKTLWEAAKKFDQNDFSGAWSALKGGMSDTLSRQGDIWSDYGSIVKNEYTSQPPTGTAAKPSSRGRGGSGDGQSDADRAKALKEFQKEVDARAAYEDAVANDELKKQKLRDAQAEAEDKAAYDAGIETLNEYYDNRAQRINDEANAEQSILASKLTNEENAAAQLLNKSIGFVQQIVAQGPAAVEAATKGNTAALNMLTKIEQTKSQMDEADLKRQKDLQENETARHQAQLQASEKLLSDRQKLYELEGNTAAAQQVALQKELAQTDELLIKLGVAESERQAILARTAANATARNTMTSLGQQGSDAMTSLQTATGAIQDQASAGAISELSAQARIYQIEKQRLPALQQIAQAMQDVVFDNELQLLPLKQGTEEYNNQLLVVENLQKQADEYTQKVNGLATSLNTTKTFAVELSNQLSQQGMQDFVNFFDAIDTGQKTASEAFMDLGKDFEAMIAHMIDQMIVYYTLMALVGWLAPGSSLFTSLSKAGPFGSLTGHAAGGYTGNAATNKVAGLVHGKEFVFNAAATSRWGLPLLQAMNAGQMGSVASASSYSSLGSMSGSGSDASALVQVIIRNESGGQVSQSQRTGPGGQNILDVVIGAVAADVAAGGKVGQTVQSTFGLSRKGTIRG